MEDKQQGSSAHTFSDPGSGGIARERSSVVWFPSYACSFQCPCPFLLEEQKELAALSLQQQRKVLLEISCRGQMGYCFPRLFTRSSREGSSAAELEALLRPKQAAHFPLYLLWGL